VTSRLRPLSDRILAWLPGRRIYWIAAWALIPLANAGGNLLLGAETSAVWEQSDLLVVLNYAALSFGVVLTLWGTARIARRSERLRAETTDVLDTDASDPFRAMNSVVGPLVIAVGGATALAVSAFLRDGWASAFLRGGTWLLLGIAFWTFLWTYACLQFGLNQLGDGRLRRDAALIDPSLGLRPLGAAAFMGLWMLLVWLVPVVLTGLPDVVGIVIGLVVLAGGLGAFFFSLWGLHRQMTAVKEGQVAIARELYAEAYEPVRVEPTLEALERQRGLISAAEALEKRALAIHDWPVDQATWAWVIGIATSVFALTLGRLILKPLGI
jgi:hypothetical protein